jgi:hypothetical protein
VREPVGTVVQCASTEGAERCGWRRLCPGGNARQRLFPHHLTHLTAAPIAPYPPESGSTCSLAWRPAAWWPPSCCTS